LFTEQDVGEWWGTELQLSKRLLDRHVITAGLEYRDDFHQERRNTGQATVQRQRESYGVYVQGDFALRDNLHFNGGVRYDQYGDFDSTYNPRLALIYNPFTNSTLKAIYGTAFRAPNFLEQGLAGPGANLQPEEITSYELVYEQGLANHLRSSVSGFYNQMDGLIVFESGSFNNFNADTRGLELALEGFWTNGVRTRLSYTLQRTETRSSRFDLPDSPEHLIKLNLSVPVFRDKVFAGVEYQYTSERDSLHNTAIGGQPVTVQGRPVPGFGTVNLTLFSRDLVKNLEFSASLYNLFDQKYSDPATRFHVQDVIEQNGRTFRVKLTYRF
jgi:iron complex outermembrane receptor protein